MRGRSTISIASLALIALACYPRQPEIEPQRGVQGFQTEAPLSEIFVVATETLHTEGFRTSKTVPNCIYLIGLCGEQVVRRRDEGGNVEPDRWTTWVTIQVIVAPSKDGWIVTLEPSREEVFASQPEYNPLPLSPEDLRITRRVAEKMQMSLLGNRRST